MRILVTGKNGQLGNELQVLSSKSKHTFFFTGHEELDITKKDEVKSFVSTHKIEAIINCAAYTAVDQAEDEPSVAYAVNDLAVGHLTEICEEYDLRLIHVSTDYVFNGDAEKPYKTDHPTDPIGVYGASKRAGEIHVINSSCDSIVVRTSWVYSSFGKNFVKTMLRLGAERDELNVVADQKGCPTYAKDLGNALLQIIDTDDRLDKNGKVYHFSNTGITTWYDFASTIFALNKDTNCDVHPISTEEFPTKAKRPKYSVLETSEIQNHFNIEIRSWEMALAECIALLENN